MEIFFGLCVVAVALRDSLKSIAKELAKFRNITINTKVFHEFEKEGGSEGR